MKKTILIFLCLICILHFSNAQIAFVNSKYILSKMPEYQAVQRQISQLGNQWQREIDEKQTVLNRMNAEYASDQVMLTDDIKKKRTEDLVNKEIEIRELQRSHFGFGGDLSKKEDSLTKPLQEKVNNSVQRVAASRNYKVVLDKSEGITVMFSDAKLDLSEDVLRDLGVK